MKIKKSTSYVIDYVLEMMEECTFLSLHLHESGNTVTFHGRTSQKFFNDNPCRSKLFNGFVAYDLVIENVNVTIIEKKTDEYDGSY